MKDQKRALAAAVNLAESFDEIQRANPDPWDFALATVKFIEEVDKRGYPLCKIAATFYTMGKWRGWIESHQSMIEALDKRVKELEVKKGIRPRTEEDNDKEPNLQ